MEMNLKERKKRKYSWRCKCGEEADIKGGICIECSIAEEREYKRVKAIRKFAKEWTEL